MVVEDFTEPNVTLDYYGGTSGTYAGFDDFGRVKQQWWHYSTSADRDKFGYGYDRTSNRTYREHGMKTLKDEHYTYDDVNRLKIFKRGTLTTPNKDDISGTPAQREDFTLDPLGNWSGFKQDTDGDGVGNLEQTRDHDKANQVTSASSWATPAHDKAGNMTTVPKPLSPANGLTLKYDAWNRLVQVTDGSTVVAKYEYDGDNRRIKKHIDSQSPGSPDGIDRYEHLFYAGVQLVETRNTTTESDQPENLQPKYQWVWSPRYIDAPILRDENTDSDGLCDDARIYYLTDANMNVTSLVDTSGTAQERYIYDPYGKVTIYDGTWTNQQSAATYNNYILYTGRHLDAETNLYYYRARYYHPDLGRFISRDPIGYSGGINLYEYVGDNPLVRTDPSGEAGFEPLRPPPAPNRNGSHSCIAGCHGHDGLPHPGCCTEARIDADTKGYVACNKEVDATFKLLYDRLDLWRVTNLDKLARAESACVSGCALAYSNRLLRASCVTDCYIWSSILKGAILVDYQLVANALGVHEIAARAGCDLKYPCALKYPGAQ